MASHFEPEAPEGCALRRLSRRFRIRRRKGPAGAPEALLGGVQRGGAPPRSLNDLSTLLALLEGRLPGRRSQASRSPPRSQRPRAPSSRGEPGAAAAAS
eukprot:15452663-Alexandrium_andersonii.AAC.1